MRFVFLGALLSLFLCASHVHASASSARELVRMARAHETAHEDDLALRRYTEALAQDAACEEAYLSLAKLRVRHGDLREAARVYDVALEHLPGFRAAHVGRAEVRRALGAWAGAVADLLSGYEEDPATLRLLAAWYGEGLQTTAQLATWRRIVSLLNPRREVAQLREARAMVRALVILVGPADPAAHPSTPNNMLRTLVASLARRSD